MEDCYGKYHHLFLCDICGNPTRARNGCDKCEKHGKINMLVRAKLEGTGIDPEEEWKEYVRLMKLDGTYAKDYPDLEFNQATWKADLEAHILSRRVKFHNGTESKERKELKVSVKQVSVDNRLIVYHRKRNE